jgi:hypothetical protein
MTKAKKVIPMNNDPTFVKVSCNFGDGIWVHATKTHMAFIGYGDSTDGEELLRIPTRTKPETKRAIDALFAVVEFLDAANPV